VVQEDTNRQGRQSILSRHVLGRWPLDEHGSHGMSDLWILFFLLMLCCAMLAVTCPRDVVSAM